MQGLQDVGVDAERLHAETFGPSIRTKRIKQTISDSENTTTNLSVSFRVSEKKQLWSESIGTLLETAELAGVSIEHGCRSGNCGTCSTAIIEGFVSYLEEPGTLVEKGSCLPCVAIPKTDLVLDA
ncbi:MAG: 2Fe-2S iron-sulfur cluster binding domain-containing protein [Proteobacteria bacterium]|nr:2Fe-2S iron-sulfur cluster binding domain-containing protein [Pseudomonadota bacterium]